jgi:hypothetical protein
VPRRSDVPEPFAFNPREQFLERCFNNGRGVAVWNAVTHQITQAFEMTARFVTDRDLEEVSSRPERSNKCGPPPSRWLAHDILLDPRWTTGSRVGTRRSVGRYCVDRNNRTQRNCT